jgi:hypothetical protein
MGEHLLDELERLTRNAALHRKDLLLSVGKNLADARPLT